MDWWWITQTIPHRTFFSKSTTKSNLSPKCRYFEMVCFIWNGHGCSETELCRHLVGSDIHDTSHHESVIIMQLYFPQKTPPQQKSFKLSSDLSIIMTMWGLDNYIILTYECTLNLYECQWVELYTIHYIYYILHCTLSFVYTVWDTENFRNSPVPWISGSSNGYAMVTLTNQAYPFPTTFSFLSL